MSVLSQQGRRMAYGMVASQFAITVLAAVLFWIFAGTRAGMSALVGGGISAAGTYYQVRMAFSPRVTGDPQRIARALYSSEAIKIVAIVALFSLALKWLDLELLPMISAFIATLATYLLALLWPPLSGNRDG